MFGEHFGLPMTGLFGGFVSSVATIGAMAVRARKADSPVHGPVAAALLSTVATFIQITLLLGATSVSALQALALPLAAGLLAIAACGGVWLWRALRETPAAGEGLLAGRSFDWRGAGGFALLFGVLQLVGAATQAWGGNTAYLHWQSGPASRTRMPRRHRSGRSWEPESWMTTRRYGRCSAR